ncbi:unnamed protein product [Closterium sp. NIES-53]
MAPPRESHPPGAPRPPPPPPLPQRPPFPSLLPPLPRFYQLAAETAAVSSEEDDIAEAREAVKVGRWATPLKETENYCGSGRGNRVEVTLDLSESGLKEFDTKLATTALESCATMALLRVLAFDPQGRPVAFDTWHDDCNSPPATAEGSTRSQWLSCDATARLAIRNHLPVTECAHFGEHRTAQALYNAVVARYSSPATAALGRLLLPYLFPELSAFATVADLVTHLRTSDARYRATVPAEDHFLTLDPTSLTVDLLEQHLLAAETSAVAVGAAHGTPRTPFFEGCSPSPLSPSFASAAAANVSVPEDVGAASTSTKRRTSKGKGGLSSGGGSGGGGGGSGSGSGGSGRGGGGSGGGGGGGTSGGSGGPGGGGGGSGGSGGSGGGGTDGGRSDLGVEALVVVWASSSSLGARPRRPSSSAQLLKSGVAIFDLDYDAIISAMYALSFSTEGVCYRCVPPDPGIAAATLGASASGTPPGTAPAEALHTFTLDSGASRCFSRDSTTLTPLPAPVPIRLAFPSGGPVVARSSIVLPCPAVPPGSLSGLHLPSFSTNLVSTTALQDARVTTTTPGGSSLYMLATEPPQVDASARVSASGQVAASCPCRLLSHQTLLLHHRLGHSSLPRLRGMHSRLLVSGLPRSLPPLPPSPAPPYLPCVEGRQRAAPHSSSFPPTSAPLQFSTWTFRLQPCERFGQDLPVLRLHSNSGGEFSSDLLRDFSRGEGITQSFTLPDSPQQNGIAERRIGLVMEVARTSMIHAAAPDFLWPFAVRYAAHQFKLWPRVSLPETSPTLRWTGKDVTFDESVPFYCLFPYHSAPPLPPPLFLAPGPPQVDPLPPQGPAPSGGAGSGGATSGGAEPGGAGCEGAGSGCAEPEGVELGGAESEGAESGVAEPRGAATSGHPADASQRMSSQQLCEWLVRRAHHRSGAPGAGGAGDTRAGGAAVPTRAGGTGGTAATGPNGARPSGAGAAGTCGVGCAGAGDPTEPGAASAVGTGAGVAAVGGHGAGGAGAAGAEVGGTGAEGAGAAGAGAVDPRAGGAGDTVRPRPYFIPLLQQPASPLPAPSPYTEQSGGLTERREPASCPVSPVRTARRAPRSRPPPIPGTHTMALPRTASPTVTRLLATAVTDPSFESAAASALVAELLDFAAACRLDYATALVVESNSAGPLSVQGECALGTNVLEDRQEDFECLAAAVPRFASMLLVPKGHPDASDIPTLRSYIEAITVPPSWANIVDGMWIFRGVDYFSTFSPTPKMTTLWVLLHVAAQRDYELHSLDFSTAFLQGSLYEKIRLCRPPGFTGMFPARTQWSLRRPVYGLRQAPREWHDTLRTTLAALGFAPSTADSSLFLHIDTSLPPFYVLVYVDDLVFATADTEVLTLVKSELQKRHTCTDLGELCSYLGLHITRRFGFQYSSPQLTPLSTSHSLSAPPPDEFVELSGPYPELVGCLMYLITCTRPDLAHPLSLLARYVAPVVLTGHADACWVDDSATHRSSQGYTFSLGSGSVSWRSTRSSSVLSSSCEASIYAGAMAAQELCWLTDLLTDLGEQPRSPPVLYVDNKAMIALCQEHRLEHIALRYFLARELQQRGQLRLAYVATRANTADVFTKALPPGDHQRFVTVLGLMPSLPHLITA